MHFHIFQYSSYHSIEIQINGYVDQTVLLKNVFNVCLFLRDRERQSVNREGAERETQNPKQVLGSDKALCGAQTHTVQDHDLS